MEVVCGHVFSQGFSGPQALKPTLKPQPTLNPEPWVAHLKHWTPTIDPITLFRRGVHRNPSPNGSWHQDVDVGGWRPISGVWNFTVQGGFRVFEVWGLRGGHV